MSGALDPLQDNNRSRLGGVSATSLISNDSGYSSMTPPEHQIRNPTKSSRKSYGLTGLGALFRRKERSVSSLVESTHLVTISQIVTPGITSSPNLSVVEEQVPETPIT
jgi:hypothetical protein